MNDALQQLHNLISWWDSLSLIQRKSRAVKARARGVSGPSVECAVRASIHAEARMRLRSAFDVLVDDGARHD